MSILYASMLLLLGTSLEPPASSDGAAPETPPPWGQSAGTTEFSLTLTGGHQFESDVDGGGSFDLTRASVTPGLTFSLDSNVSLSVSMSYRYEGYDFDGPGPFAGMDPWGDVNALSFAARLRWRADEHWTLFGGPVLLLAAEDGASLDDGITGGGFVGASYRFSDTLSIGPGLGVVSEIEGDVDVFPIVIVNWKISDVWTLRTGAGPGSTRGPGLELACQLSDTWELGIGGRYNKNRFRLDDEGPAPDGVGEDKAFAFAAALRYQPSRRVTISLLGGVRFSGELQLENDRGESIASEDYDPTPFVGVSGRVRF